MRFDPNTPTELQRQDWTCSIRSVMWMLKSIGLAVTPDEAQDAMSPKYVRSDVGLLEASGRGMAEALRDHWGVEATNDGAATFDGVAALAGRQPLAIGLRNWGGPNLGHWSAVRGFDGERLHLANPAGTGPQFGHQTLTRQEFDARGPASLVTIPLADAPVTEQLRGIDVASHQGVIDWPAVAADGIAFAITKATGGGWYTNPTLAANWRGAKAAGLVRGAYHYAFELTGATWPGPGPEAEANHFLGAMQPLGLEAGDLLVLDIEEGQGPLGEWALRWCQRVEQVSGICPLVYTGAWFTSKHGFANVPQLAEYPLWIAAYQERQPPAPAPWKSVAMWQYTNKGRVAGIRGDVDLNVFNGSRQQLLALGKGGAVEQPSPEFSVGPGILAEMQARGDAPACDEVYVKAAAGRDAYSEAFGMSGARYVWVPAVGRVVRFDPAA